MEKIITILCIFLTLSVKAQVTLDNSKLDDLLNNLYSNQKFIGNISIYKADQPIYHGDFDTFKTDTRNYHIGSVSKVYTATLLFQLIDKGVLNLNTTLDSFFPQIKYANRITIENLLSHTSGIYNITDWEDYYATRSEYFSKQRIIELLTAHKPAFKPNTDCLYSNSNYILLGFIIEEVTGKSFNDNIHERINKPLGFKNTFCEQSGMQIKPKENSYKFNGERWVIDLESDPSLPFSAGAMISSSDEMCKFIYHLFNHHIISDSSLRLMKTLRNQKIGHGIFKSPFYKKEGWGHSGRIDENRAFMAYFPEDSLSIGVTTNGLSMKLNDLIIYIMSVIYNRPIEYPSFSASNITTPPTAVFIGNYKAKLWGIFPVARFHISKAAGNYLYMAEGYKGKNKEQVLLERKGEYLYYSSESGGNLEFQINRSGKVKGVLLKQGKFTLKCKMMK